MPSDATTQHRLSQRLLRSALGLAAVLVAIRLAIGLFLDRAVIGVFGVSPTSQLGDGIAAGPESVPGSFLRWDANWLMYVSKGGYGPDGRLPTFFPVYPNLVHGLHELAGVSFEWSALLVSWSATMLAVWGLVKLGRTLWPDDHRSYRAALLFLWFPSSVFLFAGYTEATFAACAAWVTVFTVQRRYLPAAFVAALASATRPEGVVVGLVVFAALLLARRWFAAVVHGVIAVSGLLMFSIFCWFRYGNPLQFFASQDHWGRVATIPLRPLVASVKDIAQSKLPDDNTVVTFVLNDVAILAGLVGIVWLWWAARTDHRLRPLAIMATAYLLVLFSNAPAGTSPEAAARVLLCVVPLFLAVNRIRSEVVWSALLCGSVAMAVIGQSLFNLGYWFT